MASFLDRIPRHWRLPTPWNFSPNAEHYRRYHGFATFFWLIAVVPTVLWWKDSILWVALMSAYANFATEFGAWQASRAEVKVDAVQINNAQKVEAETANITNST